MKLLLALLLAATAQAAPERVYDFVRPKKVDPGTLQAELKAKGYLVQTIICRDGGTRCRIIWAGVETWDPEDDIAAHVYADPIAAARYRVVVSTK